MHKNLKYSVVIISFLISLMFLPSCKDFLNPIQDLNVTKDQLFDDWYEYRSVEMGLYGLQQEMVEQLVVLGELRADLLTVTPNADADLIEICNFKASKTNKYANPIKFYKLISACNSFIGVLKKNHPEVMDKKADVTNFDKLYGEALCMRAWAYFNAVRIYGKVPFIYESLTSVDEIAKYLNSASTYRDTAVVYSRDGYHYTRRDTVINLTKQFYDQDMVIQVFTKQLEQEVKAVGVNHGTDKQDKTWEISVWNTYAWHALLGQMYLTSGDLIKAANHLENGITNSYSADIPNRFQLGVECSNSRWRNIFTDIQMTEDIYVLKFDKEAMQQNDFQRLFDNRPPNQYMLKPTKAAIDLWEGVWRGFSLLVDNSNYSKTRLDPVRIGFPSDLYRGYGTSFEYTYNGVPMPQGVQLGMLFAKSKNDIRTVTSMMDGMDTVVYKYTVGKEVYDQDANFIVYRAGGIHLYLAEVYTWWAFDPGNGLIIPALSKALGFVNDGSNYNILVSRPQLGVRGRIGLGGPLISSYTAIPLANIIYKQNPYTNEVIGYTNLEDKIEKKQLYLEEQILNERGRELAFEGERFYDLIRMAERRNDPSFLADRVSAKFPAGQRAAIKTLLMDKKNWYINMFD